MMKEHILMVNKFLPVIHLILFSRIEMISNDTSSEVVAEATVTHILLAFHMIFINILILNLLIAVFKYVFLYLNIS